MEDKTSSKLKSMLDSKKIRNIIIVVGLIGIGLIFLSHQEKEMRHFPLKHTAPKQKLICRR